MRKRWTIQNWRNFKILQQPKWNNKKVLNQVIENLSKNPPLVFVDEIKTLKKNLADASTGKRFLLQGGDCAETFSNFSANDIKDKLKILLQMSVVLTYGASCNVIRLGRIAGQFAKPRSLNIETNNGVSLPSYRGDAVNELEFSKKKRTPNPKRMLKAYYQSAATLNLLRAFTNGGFANIDKIQHWNHEFIKNSRQGKKYKNLTTKIDNTLEFMAAAGLKRKSLTNDNFSAFFTSHEALLLDYESSLSRQDSITKKWYGCSAHFLWVGDRTRQLNSAHVEFLSGLDNPIGIKAGPSIKPHELVALCKKLNPSNELGKLTIITRMGADLIYKKLPPLIKIIKKNKLNVLWVCDPMHANTYKSKSGYKTRHFDTILQELQSFFELHYQNDSIPGGLHFEFTGENVTECLGGAQAISDIDLKSKYETACDPRLNNEQSLEMAFLMADLIRNKL